MKVRAIALSNVVVTFFVTDCVLKRWSGRLNECGRAIFACCQQ
jgi:hypothetical protein